MANKIIYINFETGNLINSDGGIILSNPTISYKEVPTWELYFLDNSQHTVNLSSAVTWHAAVDTDFTPDTEPMIRTLDEFIDKSESASGIIKVKLDSNTTTFFNKIDNKESLIATFELRGSNSNAEVIYDEKFKVKCLGSVDPQGGDPLPIPSGGTTITEVKSLLRAATEYQFCETSGGTFHPTQLSGDRFYQTRYPSGEWSQTIEMIQGPSGIGTSVKYQGSAITEISQGSGILLEYANGNLTINAETIGGAETDPIYAAQSGQFALKTEVPIVVNEITSGSLNAVTAGAVYDAIGNVENTLSTVLGY